MTYEQAQQIIHLLNDIEIAMGCLLGLLIVWFIVWNWKS